MQCIWKSYTLQLTEHWGWLVSTSASYSRGKAIPVQPWTSSLGSRKLRLPGYLDNWHMNVARLSALCTGHLLFPPQHIPGIHFCWRISQPQGHSVARRLKSMKNPNDIIGNWTRDRPGCSIVYSRGSGFISQASDFTSWPRFPLFSSVPLSINPYIPHVHICKHK